MAQRDTMMRNFEEWWPAAWRLATAVIGAVVDIPPSVEGLAKQIAGAAYRQGWVAGAEDAREAARAATRRPGGGGA